MVIAEQLKEKLKTVFNGIILTLKDFDVDLQYKATLVRVLNRLVAQGE